MSYFSQDILADAREREKKRRIQQKIREQRERKRKLQTVRQKMRVKHSDVYRAPNRDSGNTKSIHPDVRDQYFQEQRENFMDKELTKNPLPPLDDLSDYSPPPLTSRLIENYTNNPRDNSREPVTNTQKKKTSDKMSIQLKKALGHKIYDTTFEKIDPEKVLKTRRRRNKGGRKSKTRRKKKKGGGKKEIIEINKNKDDIRKIKRDIFKIKQELDNILISPEEDDTYDKLPSSAIINIDKIRSASPTSVDDVPKGGKRKTKKNRKKRTRRRRKKKKNRKKRTRRKN
tara:strand:- start:2027 stop:2884 length:858 start_codon:yes stop_codon:yes gene_type:complete